MGRAKGRSRSQTSLLDKDASETVGHFGRTARTFNTHLLYTDGEIHSKVGFSAFMRQAVDYSSLVIGAEAWVELICDQDDDVIERAQRLAADLAHFEVERHEADFEKTLNAYWKTHPERGRK